MDRRNSSSNSEKGEGRVVKKYRKVTLTRTAYKIYTYKIYISILAERVREEVERKAILPSNQTGFRKRMGTINNIYILTYLINRQVERKKEGIIIMFVNFKAEFNLVDRGKVMRAIRKK